MNYRLMIIGENQNFRETIPLLINSFPSFFLEDSFSNFREAKVKLKKRTPDLLLFELAGSSKVALEYLRYLRQLSSSVKIVVIDEFESDAETAFAFLRTGIDGYMLKSEGYIKILPKLESVFKGGAPISDKVARWLVEQHHVNHQSVLTDREQEVLQLVAKGKTCKEISQDLFISLFTARTHVRNIYQKIDGNTRSEVIQRAKRDKIIL
jgi:DNA-binding NarL/FixJ family response regulator